MAHFRMDFKAGRIFQNPQKWRELLLKNGVRSAWMTRAIDKGAIDLFDEEFVDYTKRDSVLDFDGIPYEGWSALMNADIRNYKTVRENPELTWKLVSEAIASGAASWVESKEEIATLVCNPLNIANMETKPRLIVNVKFNRCTKKSSTEMDHIRRIMTQAGSFSHGFCRDAKRMFHQFPVTDDSKKLIQGVTNTSETVCSKKKQIFLTGWRYLKRHDF